MSGPLESDLYFGFLNTEASVIHKSNLVPSDPVIRKVDYMGKVLKGKELGVGLFQRQDKQYSARFTNRYGRRMQFYDEKLSVVSCIKYNIEPAFRYIPLNARNNAAPGFSDAPGRVQMCFHRYGRRFHIWTK